MTAGNKDALIQTLDRAVTEVLAYFDGPGRTSRAKVDWREHVHELQAAEKVGAAR